LKLALDVTTCRDFMAAEHAAASREGMKAVGATALASRAHPAVASFANSPGEPHQGSQSAALTSSGSTSYSVGAAIRPIGRRVIQVVRAIEAVVVVAATETVSSGAEVIVTKVRYVIAAKAADVIGAKASNAAAANATDVISAKAPNTTAAKPTHVTSAKPTHVAAAKASHTSAMSSAAAAAARLCAGGNKAAGKYCACQNHHHSSSHDILHLRWADIPPQVQSDVGTFLWGKSQRRDRLEIGMPICRLH
jgi:hypothetical protein